MADKTIKQQVLEKLTTRNIIALSITFTFIIVVMQMTFNAKELLVVVEDNKEWVFAGGIIIGALITKFTDIVQFFFRKSSSKEPTPGPSSE